MNLKPLLMTGATGLVGSRFVDLYSAKYLVSNMDLSTGVDITDATSLAKYLDAHPADVLIHLAAFTNTNEAFKQTGDQSGLCYRVNVEGTRNLANLCRERHIHLIHISTDFVFDGTKKSAYLETDPRNPIEWYGQTKAMAEEVVEGSGATYTIVRLAYPYRAHYDLKPDLITKIRTGLESGQLYPQFTDTLITPTFIDDVARGFAAVVESKPSGTFHFVGSTSLSPYDLAVKVAAAYGFDPQSVKKGSLSEYLQANPRPFARYASLSNAKTTAELGLSFADIDTGLREIKKQQNL